MKNLTGFFRSQTEAPGRRKFIHNSIKAGALFPVFTSFSSATNPLMKAIDSVDTAKPHPLKILILGGTSFLGPQQIAYALQRGHKISIFTRGRTKPTIHKSLFHEIEHLIGDREDNLTALEDRSWDAVIDNSGHREKWTRDSAQLLKARVKLYLYTSSTGVYYPYLGSNIKENTKPVLVVPDGINETQSIEYGYGVMKANSEIQAKTIFGDDRTIVVRPTYMMGPGDRSDRFTYWPVRLDRGGQVMVPGHRDDPVQYIDVRDVADWMIRLIEDQAVGTYNAVGPASAIGMQAFVHGVHAACNSAVSYVHIDNYPFLKQRGIYDVVPWIMPTGDNFGSARVNNRYGIQNGLTYRPLADSCRDILIYWYSDAVSEDRRQKMISGDNALMARETKIITEWINR